MSIFIHESTIPLREKKYARTKIALLEAVLELVPDRTFDEIPVAELCEKAGISYATFFNYFPKKTDLLIYFIQFWTIEVSNFAREFTRNNPKASALTAIEKIFDYTARECEKSPQIMAEIIAWQARDDRSSGQKKPLTDAEKILRFPAIKDFEGLQEAGLDALLPYFLNLAVKAGDLPRQTNVPLVSGHLAAVFLGVPAALGPGNAAFFAALYQNHLKLLWDGLKKKKKTGG